jgi:hypothetical protein
VSTSPVEFPAHLPVAVLSLSKAPLPGVKPVDALYQPLPSDAYAPPLDIAVRLAREELARQQGANIHDHTAMIRAAATLEVRLRLLLDALDADDAAVVRPLAERKGGAA